MTSSIRRKRNDKFSFLYGATAQLSSKLHPSLSSILGGRDVSFTPRPLYYRGTTPCIHSTGVWLSRVPVWTFLRTKKSLVSGVIRTPYRLRYRGCHCVTGCITHAKVSLVLTVASLHCRLVCAYLMATSRKRGYEFRSTYFKLATSWR